MRCRRLRLTLQGHGAHRGRSGLPTGTAAAESRRPHRRPLPHKDNASEGVRHGHLADSSPQCCDPACRRRASRTGRPSPDAQGADPPLAHETGARPFPPDCKDSKARRAGNPTSVSSGPATAPRASQGFTVSAPTATPTEAGAEDQAEAHRRVKLCPRLHGAGSGGHRVQTQATWGQGLYL